MNKLDVFAQWTPFSLDLSKSDDGKKVYQIEGIASTENMDTAGEIILQDGLDWTYALKNGAFNYDHSNTPENILGAPTEIAKTYVEGKKATIIKGVLYATKQIVQNLIENVKAMKAAGGVRQLGFSIEGQVIARDPKNPKIITKAKVLNCAITHTPCNTDAVVNMVKNVLAQETLEKYEMISKPYKNQIAIRLQDPTKYSYFRRVDVPETHHWAKQYGKGNVSYIYGMNKKTGNLEIQAIRITVDSPNQYSLQEIKDYIKSRGLSIIKIEMPQDYKKGIKMKAKYKKEYAIEPEEMQDDSMNEESDDSMNEDSDESMEREYSDLHTSQHYADLLVQYAIQMQKLLKVLPKDFDLPEWVQAKLVIATDYIHNSYHYLEHEIQEQLDVMQQGWKQYEKGLETEMQSQTVDPMKFDDGDDYKTNDKPYGSVKIEKEEEGSIAPIVPQSLEGKKEYKPNSSAILASVDYNLSSDELKMLINKLVNDYPELSNDKIIALIAKIMDK